MLYRGKIKGLSASSRDRRVLQMWLGASCEGSKERYGGPITRRKNLINLGMHATEGER